MSSCSRLPFLIILSLSRGCYGEGPIIINFGPGSEDMFVTEESCKGDDFKVEEYKNDSSVTAPQRTNGYFLKITTSGCLVTRFLPLEADSQIKMMYRTVDPGLNLQITVGDNVFNPNMEVEGWGTFIDDLKDVPDNAQVLGDYFSCS